MKPIGQPLVIQNTQDLGWLVTWDDAVTSSNEAGEVSERVSFTVAVKRDPNATLQQVQDRAVMRALELLQIFVARPAG